MVDDELQLFQSVSIVVKRVDLLLERLMPKNLSIEIISLMELEVLLKS